MVLLSCNDKYRHQYTRHAKLFPFQAFTLLIYVPIVLDVYANHVLCKFLRSGLRPEYAMRVTTFHCRS